jgi:hypothetical protein
MTIALRLPAAPLAPPSPADLAERVAASVNARFAARVVKVGPGGGLRLAPLSSGFAALDAATGLGGFPRGRITELIGRPTAGRETVAARTVAAVADGYSAWVDVPGLVDVAHLAACGVDLERLFVLRPAEAADALAIAGQLIGSGSFAVVVLDTLADLAPGGATAGAVGRFIRRSTPALARSGTVALVLSSPSRHHRPLAHAAALRVSLTQAGLLRRGGVFRGWRTLARVLKSPGLHGGEGGLEVWL